MTVERPTPEKVIQDLITNLVNGVMYHMNEMVGPMGAEGEAAARAVLTHEAEKAVLRRLTVQAHRIGSGEEVKTYNADAYETGEEDL